MKIDQLDSYWLMFPASILAIVSVAVDQKIVAALLLFAASATHAVACGFSPPIVFSVLYAWSAVLWLQW